MLNIKLNDSVRIEDVVYKVTGVITFEELDNNSVWSEFKLENKVINEERWLTIDPNEEEFLFCEKLNESFDKSYAIELGYNKFFSGGGKVTSCEGDTDVYFGDVVYYEEFEDAIEVNALSIEKWDDCTEYSKGKYLEEHEIQVLFTNEAIALNPLESSTFNETDNEQKKIYKTIGVIGFISILVIIIMSSINDSHINFKEFLSNNHNFQYVTSITSDANSSEMADIFETNFTIKETKDYIIQNFNDRSLNVEENEQENSVAIISDEEYCLIYNSEDNKTLVQISSRLYTYSSSNNLYHSRPGTFLFYRRFYYNNGYSYDSDRYNSYRTNYRYNTKVRPTPSGIPYNGGANNIHNSGTNNIRQSSTGARSSSGGGTSSGK